MDGREGMAFPGSASYYLHRGGIGGPGGGSGPSHNLHGGGGGSTAAQSGGMNTTHAFKTPGNPSIQMQPNVVVSGGALSGSPFRIENPTQPNFSQGVSMGIVSASQSGEPVKKKRGRPRKYGPDGANMSLGLSPMPPSKPTASATSSGEKAKRGRPPGTGWKQKLAPLGEWMNNSAGLAFTPHVLQVGSGEDVAAKILAFAQQRPRALCIMSATGSVSAVTLRQPTTSSSSVTYEGRFEILCLSGSYLVAESGGPRNRTGGISISVCSPDGHIIGGAIGGRLIAANPVQVVACSFVYGGTKPKNDSESGSKDEKQVLDQSAEKSSTPTTAASTQSFTPNSGSSVWPLARHEVRNPQKDIDLMRG